MCSTGVVLARTCVVLMCFAAAARVPPTKVHAGGAGNGHLGIPTNASLAHCPSHCGDVEISYPFGIGPGCFRRGFELTCDNITGSPKLLFLGNSSTQVTSMDVSNNYVWTSVGYNISMGLGADTYITKSWKAPTEGVIIDDKNLMYVVGCGVHVYMFGDNTTDLIGYCTSICPDNREIMERANMGDAACGGFGCCYITLSDRQAFTLKLGRDNSTIPQLLDEDLSSVKVFFSVNYEFVIGDLYASWVDTSNVGGMLLEIAITDQPSCASAQSHVNKDTYACNRESICNDLLVSRGGYNCFCVGQLEGNPYVAGGCIQDYNPNAPKENCTRFCGNMTIPFPFGIEEGCFANDNLQLNCTSNGTTLLDQGYAQFRVTNLSLDDELLTVTNMLNDTSSNNMERIVINHYGGSRGCKRAYTCSSTDDVVEDDIFDFSQEDIIIKLVIANLTCQVAKLNNATYACISDNSFCEEVMRGKTLDGYRCKCSDGFQGNPYLQNNCTDIDECSIPNKCNGICHNFDGGFNCTRCPHGKEYDTNKHKCVMSAKQRNLILGIAIGLACGLGFISFTLGTIVLTGKWKKDIQRRIRRAYFKKNQGLLLEQLISNESVANKTKIFTLEELEEATNKFDTTRVLGHGGHDTVYKRILPDQRIVAIKNPK